VNEGGRRLVSDWSVVCSSINISMNL